MVGLLKGEQGLLAMVSSATADNVRIGVACGNEELLHGPHVFAGCLALFAHSTGDEPPRIGCRWHRSSPAELEVSTHRRPPGHG
jgi:hypothetical protein